MVRSTLLGEGRAQAVQPAREQRLESPSGLWLILLTSVVSILVAAIVAGITLSGRQQAASHTAQSTEVLYADVQDLAFSLAGADATAATALLIGPEPPGRFTSRFDTDITQAEEAISTTVGSGANVGTGGCEPMASAVHRDLLQQFKVSQAQLDSGMTSPAENYAGSYPLPLALAIGLLGAAGTALGINRRLAEYR